MTSIICYIEERKLFKSKTGTSAHIKTISSKRAQEIITAKKKAAKSGTVRNFLGPQTIVRNKISKEKSIKKKDEYKNLKQTIIRIHNQLKIEKSPGKIVLLKARLSEKTRKLKHVSQDILTLNKKIVPTLSYAV